MIFGGSQVLMDVEPLVHMIRGDAVLHGISHTVAGAFVIAIVSAVVGRPICGALLARSRIMDRPISWPVAWVSALVGTYSHILLDAIMHSDMTPLWPFAYGNPLLGIISVTALHVLCVACGVVGGLVVGLRLSRSA
jgi:membrane-bound metal-dependent hydrolase YbcI (DUF457 family)